MAYDYELIEGRDRDGARKALKRSVKNGFAEEDVISVENGWLVPTDEADEAEPLGAVEATIDAWGEERQEVEGSANIENQENDSQPADGEYFDGKPVGDELEDRHEEFFASAKVADLDDFIDANDLDVDKSLNKSDKVAAIKAAQENKE